MKNINCCFTSLLIFNMSTLETSRIVIKTFAFCYSSQLIFNISIFLEFINIECTVENQRMCKKENHNNNVTRVFWKLFYRYLWSTNFCSLMQSFLGEPKRFTFLIEIFAMVPRLLLNRFKKKIKNYILQHYNNCIVKLFWQQSKFISRLINHD